MVERTKFQKGDIGAEILPILTTGLYSNTLDTLREYIQNSIDAKANKIELLLDPDVVSIRDDGIGMNETRARRAIRLGFSEKNPLENVGFRGIGIYSAFNMCDSLAIYTRARRQKTGYVLQFDFKGMRDELLKEAERAKQDKPRILHLEKLLQETVSVVPDDEGTLRRHGTLAVFSGVREEVYDLLMDWEGVTRYLQDVVPLPFRPDFKYKKEIEEQFETEDYRVVREMVLQIGSRREELFRPYYDGMYSGDGDYEPQFFDASVNGRKMGFAWACMNDARKALPVKELRGILIKKFGFSISDRNFLEPYYGRPVFNRRLTGELIVQDKELIPNAARSEFEHNAARQMFLQDAVPGLIKAVSAWANQIQQEEKALEVLEESAQRVAAITSDIPSLQRDKERLLDLNVELARIEEALTNHEEVLKKSEASDFRRAKRALTRCQRTVREALIEQRRSQRTLEERTTESVQAEDEANADGRGAASQPIISLIELLDGYDLLEDPELRRALTFLDEEILQVSLAESTYREALSDLSDHLEDET